MSTYSDSSVIFSGEDAIEYMRICDHEYGDDPQRGSLSQFLSDHMTCSYDFQTGAIIIESDLLNFELPQRNTIMYDYTEDDFDSIENSDDSFVFEKSNANTIYSHNEIIEIEDDYEIEFEENNETYGININEQYTNAAA